MRLTLKKALSIASLEILLYSVFLAMVTVENYFVFIAIAVGSYGVILAVQKKAPGLYRQMKGDFQEHKGFAVGCLFLLLLTFPILEAKNPYWIQIAIMAGLYVMLALGLNVMVGNAGLTSLGYAAFYGIGAYTYGILALRYGVSFWLSLIISIVITMLFGFLLGLPALRVKGHYLSLVTIAFGLVVYQLLINLEGLTGGTNGLINIPAPHLGGYSFNSIINLGFIQLPFHTNYYYLMLVFVGLSVLIAKNISQSLTGLTWNALREDELAAQCYGVNLTKNKLWAFALGSAFAGIAGVFYAGMVGFIAPENFTYNYSILFLSMILLGGIDSIPGVILGAVLLTIIPEKFQAFADYRNMFYGIVIVLILMFKKDGLIPAQTRKFTSLWTRGESDGTFKNQTTDHEIRRSYSGE